jgi:8-oxo-dGTP diphosphatase
VVTGSVLRSDVLVDAPPRTVTGVLRDADVTAEVLRGLGHRFSGPARLLAVGDEVRLAVRVLPGVRIPVRTRIDRVDDGAMVSTLARGPVRAVTHAITVSPSPVGTLVREELSWTMPLGPLGRLADRILVCRLLRGVLTARAGAITARAERLVDDPAVVATALVRDGRVLAAQRTRPPELAGRWELPGGRVEPGEDERAAVVRECREELGTDVVPGGRVGTDLPIDAGVLRVYRAEPARDAAEPQPLEHAALRWVDAAEARTLDWAHADRTLVDDLVQLLDDEGRGSR